VWNDARIEIDLSPYPRITGLYRVGLRGVEAMIGERRFRVTIYEALHDRTGPVFSANYEEEVQLLIGGQPRPLLVKSDLPWEAADTIDECLQAALARVNDA
jgi:hypothetical protein